MTEELRRTDREDTHISKRRPALNLERLLLDIDGAGSAVTPSSSCQPTSRQSPLKNAKNFREIHRPMTSSLHQKASRVEKIARIREALADGTYKVAGRAVADAVIKHVLTDSVL